MPRKKHTSIILALVALVAICVSFIPALDIYGLYVFMLATILLIIAPIMAISNVIRRRRTTVQENISQADKTTFKKSKYCKLCGRRSFLDVINVDGYCPDCAKTTTRINREREQAEERKRAETTRVRNLIESIPDYEINLAETPHKRNVGYDAVMFSNITPKGNYSDIVVFDTETTGLSPSKDRIIEIAAIRFIDRHPVAKFHTYINPGRPIPEESIDIHGITDDVVANSPMISGVIPAFDSFVGSSTLVAHNLDFDLRFVLYSGSELLNTKRKYIDTLAQAQRILKKPRDVENHKLATLCSYYGITIGQEHGALYDAYATGILFFRLVDEIQ